MNAELEGVVIRTVMSPYLVLRQLSLELYTYTQCLAELLRNSANACMVKGKWEPQRVKVELSLVHDYPLAPGIPTLLFFDRGCGFNKEAYEAIENLGPSAKKSKNALHGSQQKNIGRLAPFKLIRAVSEREDIDSGFFIITRALSSGPIQIFHYTARKIAESDVRRFDLPPDCEELGPYKGIKGSFTMVVIPDTTYESLDAIRTDLRESLPRLNDLSMDVKVGGKPLTPPPLPRNFKGAGKIKAWIGLSEVARADGGILLVDAATGFVCCKAKDLTTKQMPYPLQNVGLEGIIAIPDLLANQDTGRSKLLDSFVRSAQWKRVVDVLRLHIVPFAMDLMDDEDVIKNDNPHHNILMEFADMFDEANGIPTIVGGDLPGIVVGGRDLPKDRAKPKQKRPTRRIHARGRKHPAEGDGKVRGRAVIIGGKEYIMRLQPRAHPFEYAIPAGGSILGINPNYKLKCKTQTAYREHLLWRLLLAVAREQNEKQSKSPEEIELYATEMRHGLNNKNSP